MKKRTWTKRDIELLKIMYSDDKINNIVQKFNISWERIRNKAKNLGFKRKRVKCFMKPGTNHEFFDNWSEKMAYILGFIAADGCVAQSKKYLSIKLAKKDLRLLRKIRDLVAPKVKIRNEIVIKDGKTFRYVKFVVCSTYMVSRLISLGIVPKKSLVLKFPNVPKKYVRHFIRGYFDGDGCISKDKNRGAWSVSALGTKEFLDTVGQKISENIKIELKRAYKKEEDNIYKIKYVMHDAIKIHDFFYKDATICLERKHRKFLKFLSEKKGNMRKPIVSFKKEEDEFIKKNFIIMNNEDIAKQLNRSIDGIRKRAYKLTNKRKHKYPINNLGGMNHARD